MLKINSVYRQSLHQFHSLLNTEKTFFKIIVINSIVISFLGLIIPISVQTIINKIVILKVLQPLLILSFIVFLVLLFSGVVQSIQVYIIENLKRRLFTRLMHFALKKFMHFEDESFQKVDTPALVNRMTDILFLQTSSVAFFGEGMAFAVQYLFGILFLMFYHPYLFLLSLFISFLFYLSWKLFGSRGVEAGSPEADARYEVMGLIQEVAAKRHPFMSENKETFIEQKLHEKCLKWVQKRDSLFKEQFGQSIFLQIIQTTTYTLLLGVGGSLVLSQELSLGQLVASTLMITIILTSLSRLQVFYTSVFDFTTNLDKLAEFEKYPEENFHHAQEIPSKALIQFKDVHQKPDVRLNFQLRENSLHYIYIKSFYTVDQVIKLIQGFIKPEHGRVMIDNFDTTEINLRKWRDDILYVHENNFIRGSIKENIWPFEAPVSESQIKNALEDVGLWERIEKLDLKLETILAPNGHPLSLSQLITLQFATALLQKPKLLIIGHDFEKMSAFKRKRILELMKSNRFESTIIFFSQNLYPNVFSDFHMLGRDGVKTLHGFDELKKVVQTAYGFDL